MSDDLTDLYQEVILEHAKSLRNSRCYPTPTVLPTAPIRSAATTIPLHFRFAKRFRKKCVRVMGRSPRHHKHFRKPEAKGYTPFVSSWTATR